MSLVFFLFLLNFLGFLIELGSWGLVDLEIDLSRSCN